MMRTNAICLEDLWT